jgi:hypothetical protein
MRRASVSMSWIAAAASEAEFRGGRFCANRSLAFPERVFEAAPVDEQFAMAATAASREEKPVSMTLGAASSLSRDPSPSRYAITKRSRESSFHRASITAYRPACDSRATIAVLFSDI